MPKAKTQEIDIEALKEEIREEIKSQIEFERRRNEHIAEERAKAEASLTRSELVLAAKKTYKLESNTDGFMITENDKPTLTINKAGAAGFGTKAPRSSGLGSAHFRAWYTSEAPLPTSGLNSTRGVIIEGDGDDEKTYTLRTVSRKNRQGFNITGNGNILAGLMNDPTGSKMTVVHNEYEGSAYNAYVPSKYYTGSVQNLQANALPGKQYNFINAVADADDNGGAGIDVFRVDGLGTVYANNGLISNRTGYGELYEWSDGNNRNEDRVGFTVTVDADGNIRIADEGDEPIGVISDSAAFVGNVNWNNSEGLYYLQENGQPRKRKTKIVEWEDDVGVLHSYYLETLNADFALPDNAVIYETTEDGDDIEVSHKHDTHDKSKSSDVDSRWAVVVFTGKVKVYKGQIMSDKWIKVREISDELEEWILR
jgi:hypothetical protein